MRTRGFRHVCVAAVFLAVLGVSVQAEPAGAERLAAIRVGNFGQVSDHYYRGAQPVGRDYKDLAALGVKMVIDLTGDGEASLTESDEVRDAGMAFERIPLSTRSRPSTDAVNRFLELVNNAANQPVFVHCQGGHHRTGVMTAVYRMTADRWSADRAYAEMQRYGFGPAFLHSSLKNFVYEFARGVEAAGRSLATAAAR